MNFTGERFIPEEESINELSVEHLHRYHTILPIVKGKNVLDIACGEGYGTAIIAGQALAVTGIDVDEECITHASSKYNKHTFPHIDFIKGLAENIPCKDNIFDIVVSFETIEHLSEADQHIFLLEIKRVLKKDGILIMSTPDKANYSDRYEHHNPFHLHELTRTEFSSLLSKSFKSLQFFEQGFEIVSIVSNDNISKVTTTPLISWVQTKKSIQRKYLIGLASDTDITLNNISSIVLDSGKSYFKQIDRILDLQQEVEGLGKWGQSLDKIREKNESTIEALTNRIAFMNPINLSLKELVAELKNIIHNQVLQQTQLIEFLVNENKAQQEGLAKRSEQLSELHSTKSKLEETANTAKNYLNEITELKNIIRNQEDAYQFLSSEKDKKDAELKEKQQVISALNFTTHFLKKQLLEEKDKKDAELKEKQDIINDLTFNYNLTKQQLSDINNQLITIYHSDGWKWLKKYYNLKGRVLNENSTHYKVLRKSINFLRGRKVYAAENNYKTFEQIKEKKKTIRKNDIEPLTFPLFEHPSVSIIIPVYNAWSVNVKCLQAIHQNSADVAYELILADDASSDETKNCTNWFKNIVHVRNEENKGFLLNCNHAADFAKGKYIVFLNNDTEVKSGWLSSLVVLMERDNQIGLAGSKLIYPDGLLQEAGGIIWKDASGWNYGNRQTPDAPEYNYVKEVDYISGASIMIRSELWKQLGGFDTRYSPAYCEDSDLAFSVREKGYKVVYQPLSEVIHYEGYSHGSDSQESQISSVKEYQAINNKQFYEKWKSVLSSSFANGEDVFHARDRTQGKKTLLMVDHYVPQFDKDAGSKTTFQYLQLFVKMGFNVKFIGENFYKHEPYTSILQQLGIEVLYGAFYANNWENWFKDNANYIDYIYLNRPHISINYIDFFKENSNATILYYGHDLHFLREQKRHELTKNDSLLDEIKKWKKIETYLFEKSDVILTPSIEEEKIIKSLNSIYNVQLMQPYIYDSVSDPITDFETRENILFVGGFNHLPNVDAILWFLKEVWPTITNAISGIKFIVAGSNPPNEIIELASDDIIIKGYISEYELEQLYKSCKLAVIPLRFGAGVKGKTVEAMRHGLPLVSTSFGVEGLPGNYSFVTVADNAKDFSTKVILLYNTYSLSEVSKLEIEYIREHFSEENAIKMIEGFIK